MNFDPYDPACFLWPAIDKPLSGAQMRENRVHVRYQDRRLFSAAAGAVLLAILTALSWYGMGVLQVPLLCTVMAGVATVAAAAVMAYFDIKMAPTRDVAGYSLSLPLSGLNMGLKLEEWALAYGPVQEYLALVGRQRRPVMVGDYCFLRDWVAAGQRQMLAPVAG